MTIPGDEQQVKKPAPKAHTLTNRLAKTPKQAALIALAAAGITLILPIRGLIINNWDVCGDAVYFSWQISLWYKIYIIGSLMPVALIAAGLGVLLARRAHKYLAIVLGVILLAALVVLNLFVIIGAAGC